MGGETWIFGLAVASLGCASGLESGGESDDLGLVSCGISDGAVFDIQVGRVTFSPADSNGQRWDSSDEDVLWDEDLVEWRGISRTISTHGSFKRGSYDEVEAVNRYFESTLFASNAAPDPMALLYASDGSGSGWEIAQEWGQIAGNTHQVDGLYLGRWALGGDKRINLRFLDADAPDETRVGDLVITGVIAQSIANCGPMGMVLSESEMRKEGNRVHAIEIEVEVID